MLLRRSPQSSSSTCTLASAADVPRQSRQSRSFALFSSGCRSVRRICAVSVNAGQFKSTQSEIGPQIFILCGLIREWALLWLPPTQSTRLRAPKVPGCHTKLSLLTKRTSHQNLLQPYSPRMASRTACDPRPPPRTFADLLRSQRVHSFAAYEQ